MAVFKPYSRRILFIGLPAALVLVALGVVTALVFPTQREPFFGTHQAGITTAPQKFAFVAAFDVTAPDADELRGLLKTWTATAEALTQGHALGAEDNPSAPPADTGESTGYRPARLTLTFGAGRTLFDGRFGLAERLPSGLVPLPAFRGDALIPGLSDGDLVVQAAADDLQTAYHALHVLSRAALGRASLRWVQQGFQPGPETNAEGPNRNLQGFEDGTVNPDTANPDVMDSVVWASSKGMEGGSYLVVRRVRLLVETWDRTALGEQERTIGRARETGEKLPALAADSHVRVARGAGVETLLRRPFHYVNGLDAQTGQWDAGLLFLAWTNHPARNYIPLQTRLSENDRLNEYIRTESSSLFAIFPGVKPGEYLGQSLVPEPPLAPRIEALVGRLGALYPVLGRGDWAGLRAGAAAWTADWNPLRPLAGAAGTEIDAKAVLWTRALGATDPDPQGVRSAQTALVKALDAWAAGQNPAAKGAVTDLGPLVSALARTEAALGSGDAAGARTQFQEFQRQWLTRESLVRGLDGSVYSAVELTTGTVRQALASEPPSKEALDGVRQMTVRLKALAQPRGFSAWDAGFLLFREGLEALLVLAALVAFLGRTGQKQRTLWVWSGAAAGLVASAGVALAVSVFLAGWSASSTPALVEGTTGLVAVALMLTVGAWLHGKANVKNWNLWLKDQMGRVGDSPWALAFLAFLAILREGAETVVFFWGLAGSLSPADLILGIGGALAVLAVLGVLIIGFSKRLPLNWFFPLATGLIYFLAVKILGQSLGALQSAGILASTALGFGGPVEGLGYLPTWQTAVPQVLLMLLLGSLLVRSLVGGHPKPPKAA